MSKGLTEKQRNILEFIIDFQKENGFPPTIRELGDAFAIGSLRGVTVHLDALVRKGCMSRERTSRSIRILVPDPRTTGANVLTAHTGRAPGGGDASATSATSLPLIRGFAAPLRDGVSITDKTAPDALVERTISIPDEIASPATPNGFVVRVGATGVYGEPIIPGDLLVVRPQRKAATGELVVVWSRGDMAICRSEGASEREEEDAPHNDETEIMGRVVGLIRRY